MLAHSSLAKENGLTMIVTKLEKFNTLATEARSCQRCENLRERIAVLSYLNGNINPKVMFIAEAPGRNGGDRTRIPMKGDASGANFDKFIASIGLEREDIFITNSVLCNPRKDSGANRKPTRIESVNCADFLRRQIETLDAPIIATLGAVALEALKAIAYHQFSLKRDAGKICDWRERILVPLYHPSPQVIASSRRVNQQIEDYQILREAIIKIYGY